MIAEEYIPEYGPQGFQPVIIHVGTEINYGLSLAADSLGIFPILLDTNNTILDIFQQLGPNSVLFPLAYLIDREGVIRHVYNKTEAPGEVSPETLLEDLEVLLAE